jgi:hypothetical protein
MLVRQVGFLRNVTLKIGTHTAASRTESLQPITDIGFERMATTLLKKLGEEMRLDPEGDNTEVEQRKNATIDGRPCTYIRVTHPKPQSGLTFHVAEVFVDDEYQLPVRVVSYEWPHADHSDLRLISEYNYTRLRLNVGLADADFEKSALSPEGQRIAGRLGSAGLTSFFCDPDATPVTCSLAWILCSRSGPQA